MLVSNCKYFSHLCSFFIKARLCVCLHLFYFCAVATEDPFLSIIFLSTVLLLLCITEKLHCWIMIFSSYLMSEHGCPKKNPKEQTMVQDQVRREKWPVEENRLWEKTREQRCQTPLSQLGTIWGKLNVGQLLWKDGRAGQWWGLVSALFWRNLSPQVPSVSVC